MSLPNERERNYELVDVDVSIVSLEEHTTETTNITPAIAARPPTLPTGEVIDAKNTLQSFGSPGTPIALDPPPSVGEPEMPVHPTLPDGQVITGKNTLQSFREVIDRNQQTPFETPQNSQNEVKPLSQEDRPSSMIATSPPSTTVVAVAVESDIIYAEVVPEPVLPFVAPDHHENHNAPVEPTTPWYQARSTYVLLTIISLLLAIVLGVSIGLSNGSSNDTPVTIVPTSAPISAMPTRTHVSAVPTTAPIAMDPNITIRAAVFTSYINNITLSDQIITQNGTSPESKALAWMIANDTTLETSAVISEVDPIARNAIGFRIQQRYPLLVMWFQQNETVKWAITTGWLVDESECAWYGISCKPLAVYYYGEDYNGGSQNVVTQIAFNLIGSYVGVIPSDIGLLSNLEHMEIKTTRDYNIIEDGRYLKGSLPDSTGLWTALTYFDVSGNGLTGTLPDSIGQWTALTYFNAYNYGLTGTLPDSFGQWADLTYFDVSFSSLNGTLPDSIGQWTALTYFDVSVNYGLNGLLPDTIGQWTALTYFSVYSNALYGTIPSSILEWSLIENADFSGNSFVGTLPNAFCQYIDPDADFLQVDCTVNCTCCNDDCF
jgi:hypothetical protein